MLIFFFIKHHCKNKLDLEIVKSEKHGPEFRKFDESNIFWLEKLGEGGFGLVKKAFDKLQNQFVAIKLFKNCMHYYLINL